MAAPATVVRKAKDAPAASASPRSDSISAWLSTMPVDGDSNAPAQVSAGSRLSASARVNSVEVADSALRRALVWIACSLSNWSGSTATISLPVRLWAMSCSRQ